MATPWKSLDKAFFDEVFLQEFLIFLDFDRFLAIDGY